LVGGKETTIAIKEIVPRSPGHPDHSIIPSNVRQDWEGEATALGKLRDIRHENLIQCIAVIAREDKYLFLFPCADGGTLRDWWGQLPDPKLTPEFIKEVLVQLHGLADGLHAMHSYMSNTATLIQGGGDDNFATEGGGIRYGDLKPENILRFAAGDDDVGILKITDMRLAKHHEVNTRLRKNATRTKYRTTRYEPPEVTISQLPSPATSRLYDVWSMGCIILELLIWLVWGNRGLVAFHDTIQGGGKLDMEHPYYVIKEESGQERTASVHPMVTRYIEELTENSACAANTALGDLLEVIRTKLLVVPLPPSGAAFQERLNRITPAGQADTNEVCYRASARSLAESLASIIEKGKANDGYWLTAPRQTKTPDFTQSRRMCPDSTPVVPINPGVGVLSANSPPTAAIPRRETVGPSTTLAATPYAKPGVYQLLAAIHSKTKQVGGSATSISSIWNLYQLT
jgi:serine/threonine protein kinase